MLGLKTTTVKRIIRIEKTALDLKSTLRFTMKSSEKRGGLGLEYTKLGNTGMDVSRICLGAMGFGDRSSAIAVIVNTLAATEIPETTNRI